jgi:hypothetical protein
MSYHGLIEHPHDPPVDDDHLAGPRRVSTSAKTVIATTSMSAA